LAMGSSEDPEKYYNPIEQETVAERDSRMKLVRGLQKTFYKNEEGAMVPELVKEDASPGMDSSVVRNLPLWRSPSTEFPGSQTVLNVEVPAYTNMFQKILKGQSKDWSDYDKYNNGEANGSGEIDFGEALRLAKANHNICYFGHVKSATGEDIDNPTHGPKVGDIGTLMKIADSRQQKNGQMTLVVQAVEKFEIKRIDPTSAPYAIVDVTILPDTEQLLEMHPDTWNTTTLLYEEEDKNDDNTPKIQNAKQAAAKYALANHFFEYKDVSVDECESLGECKIENDGELVGMLVAPLSSYDPDRQVLIPNEELELRTQPNPYRDYVAVAESDTWIQLDELLTLLKRWGTFPAVPSQLLGLLPVSSSVLVGNYETNTAGVEKAPWPATFRLEAIVREMKGFVIDRDECEKEVDDGSCDIFDYTAYYSPLRRAQRLSYVIWTWILTESIDLSAFYPEDVENGSFDREDVLEMESTRERLELATERMNKICLILKREMRSLG